MRLEIIPLILGVLVALLGVGLLFDAWTPDEILVKRERRRQQRIERHRGVEALVGVGVLCMAAAFIGRDTWVYSVIAVIAGALLLLMGMWLNRAFLKATVSNRGALRRRDENDR